MLIKKDQGRSSWKQILWLLIFGVSLVLISILAKAIPISQKSNAAPKIYLTEDNRHEIYEQKDLLSLINNHDGTLLLAVNDESSANLNSSLREKLKNLGAEELSQLGWRQSYVGQVQAGKFVTESRSSDQAQTLKFQDYEIESAGFDHGKYARISDQNRRIDMGERGLNVAVLTPDDQLLAVYSFDLFGSAKPKPKIRLFNVKFDEIPTLKLRINQAAYEKLRRKRDEAVKKGVLLTEEDDLVSATFSDGKSDRKCDIRLKGDWTDHLVGDQWSFRVNLESDESWNGMQKFSLHHPKARNYLGEWLYHQALAKEDILHLKYDFVQLHLEIDRGVTREDKYLGLYAAEEFFTKNLIERNQRREGILLKLDEDPIWRNRAEFVGQGLPWGDLEASEVFRQDDLPILPFGGGAVRKDSNLLRQFQSASALFQSYLDGELSISEVFDVEKLATANVITNLLGADHALISHNYRMYYNPINGKLEPVGFDGDSGRENYYPHQYMHAVDDTAYVAAYVRAIERLTTDDAIWQLKHTKGLEDRKLFMESALPEFRWDPSFIDFNRKVLQELIQPKQAISAFVESYDANSITLSVDNHGRLPIHVLSLQTDEGRDIAGLKTSVLLAPRERQTLRFAFAENFERLFVSKKGKVDFDLSKDIEKIRLQFSTVGASSPSISKIFSWSGEGESVLESSAFLRMESSVDKFDFLHVDEKTKQIICHSGTHQIEEPMIIPAGYSFVVGPGTKFEMVKHGSRIISYSPLQWQGTAENPITVYATTRDGRGIMVMNAESRSRLEHCRFLNLRNLTSAYWSVSGAVNFYESDVDLSYCTFERNRCEDALNIIRSDFDMQDCIFSEIQSDAFDGDFVTGEIRDCQFLDIGNDAIDVSGSDIDVKRVNILRAGDKGLSAGEDSKMRVDSVRVSQSEIGVASKDMSYVELREMKIHQCALGFTAFQKKPEYGPASITAVDVELRDVVTIHLIEEQSRLRLNGELATTESRVKDQMYGVIYGKKSER